MLIGGELIKQYIQNGVPARFNDEGVQILVEDAITKDDNSVYYYKLIEDTIEPLIIEGAVYDLRLNNLFSHSGRDARLFVDTRNTGKDTQVFTRKISGRDCYLLKSNQYYLGQTTESVNMPANLQGLLFPRTTMFRAGIQILCGTVAPNYFGSLTFGLLNISSHDLFIEKDFRCLSIAFEYIDGISKLYNGNWQSGEKVGSQGSFNPAR